MKISKKYENEQVEIISWKDTRQFSVTFVQFYAGLFEMGLKKKAEWDRKQPLKVLGGSDDNESDCEIVDSKKPLKVLGGSHDNESDDNDEVVDEGDNDEVVDDDDEDQVVRHNLDITCTSHNLH
jgi:hypothetical protein